MNQTSNLTFQTAISKGYELQVAGKLQDAEAIYKQLLVQDPNNADALHLMGMLAQQLGKNTIAVEYIEKAIHRNSSNFVFYNTLGIALQSLGNLPRSVEAFENAKKLDESNVDVLVNLANAYQNVSDKLNCIAVLKEVLALRPNEEEVLLMLANLLVDNGEPEQAIAYYQQLITIRPNHAEAHSHMGLAYRKLHRLEDAFNSISAAIGFNSESSGYYNQLAEIYQLQNRNMEAVTTYKHALSLDPGNKKLLVELAHQRQHLCLWDEDGNLSATDIEEIALDVEVFSPFSFMTFDSNAKQQLYCANKRSLEMKEEEQFAHAKPSSANRGKIRIGYISQDFRIHPVANLIVELFEKHDRDKYEVFAYSFGPEDGSGFRKRIIAAFDTFAEIGNLSFADSANLIHDDKIDILVDLTGYTGGCRPNILARKPAPMQINYLGYPGTTGASYMDYIIVDSFIVAFDQQKFYAEKLVQMPHCYQINDRKRVIPQQGLSREDHGLPAQGFIFCSFNNTYKITSAVFNVWMKLLQEVPGSVLWLLEPFTTDVSDNLIQSASRQGVDRDRLVFAPRASVDEHLARHQLVDLFLDTYPVNAHTTASDALWAGCPLITLAGETFISRVAGSILKAVGMEELITYALEDYQALALALAQDPERLAKIRARLQENRLTHPLFDSDKYVENFELALDNLWSNYLAGKEAEGFAVSTL